jgi:hypothetical protein
VLTTTVTGGGALVLRESWSTRWYVPLVGLAALMVAVLVLALAFVEVLIADDPDAVALHAWTAPLSQMEAALDRGDTAEARSAWREARAAAIRSRQWEGMLAVGDASRRFGFEGRARAREAYLTALFRARREGSLEGLLGAAAAFGELGDREVLVHALRLAERQGGRDPFVRTRIRRIVDRWLSPPIEAEHHDPALSGGKHP